MIRKGMAVVTAVVTVGPQELRGRKGEAVVRGDGEGRSSGRARGESEPEAIARALRVDR